MFQRFIPLSPSTPAYRRINLSLPKNASHLHLPKPLPKTFLLADIKKNKRKILIITAERNIF